MSLGLENPALPSIVLSLLLGLVLFFLARLWDQPSSIGLWALVGTSPVFMRYFSQHMPDLCAVLFLVVGVWARVRKKNAWAFCFFVLACTTKLLVVFPVAMILLEGALDERGRPKSLKAIVVALLQVVFAAVPFLLWIKGLHFYGILNPFGFKSLVANRHSGGWSLLWTPAYWSHFATWVGSKGVGWPLLIFALVSMVRRYRDVGVFGPSSFDRLLFFWSLGLVPYWILVRAGNFTHDYYFLPFFVPIAFLGARQLLEFRPCWARWIFVFLSLGVGLAQPWRLSKDLDVSSLAAAPSFCGMETGKYREAP